MRKDGAVSGSIIANGIGVGEQLLGKTVEFGD
jgi:hypothetical protein